MTRTTCWASLVLYHTGEGRFDLDQHGEAWLFFASQAVVALRHAQLLAEAQTQTTRLQAVIETAMDVIVIIDEHGLVEMCNPAFETGSPESPRCNFLDLHLAIETYLTQRERTIQEQHKLQRKSLARSRDSLPEGGLVQPSFSVRLVD